MFKIHQKIAMITMQTPMRVRSIHITLLCRYSNVIHKYSDYADRFVTIVLIRMRPKCVKSIHNRPQVELSIICYMQKKKKCGKRKYIIFTLTL